MVVLSEPQCWLVRGSGERELLPMVVSVSFSLGRPARVKLVCLFDPLDDHQRALLDAVERGDDVTLDVQLVRGYEYRFTGNWHRATVEHPSTGPLNLLLEAIGRVERKES